jgi:hypothetical protein
MVVPRHAIIQHREGMGMAGSDPEEQFRVTDRRRRVADDEPAQAEAPASPPPPREEARARAPESEPQPAPAAEPIGSPEDEPPEGERGLEDLFVMLASSAVVALGDAADPVTGQVRRDPDAAADAIDLLLLLRQKTEGNRTLRETQLLDGLIYDLQMRFVNATRPRL